jgi:uncharacterized protein
MTRSPLFRLNSARTGHLSALLGGIAFAAVAGAQTLSSPIGTPAGKPPAAATAPIAGGQGPGLHGANSPFAPLEPRADIVPWSVLTDVKTKNEKNRILPVFNAGQTELNDKTQRIQGFMMPLDPGEKQKHFLLSSVPLTCSFCLPGGPESLVEVKTRTPIRYSMEPVVVEGRFMVLPDDKMGLYYRVTDAVGVK